MCYVRSSHRKIHPSIQVQIWMDIQAVAGSPFSLLPSLVNRKSPVKGQGMAPIPKPPVRGGGTGAGAPRTGPGIPAKGGAGAGAAKAAGAGATGAIGAPRAEGAAE